MGGGNKKRFRFFLKIKKVSDFYNVYCSGTKYEGTNFEIDFFIVTGRNLFVVEVGERHMDKVDDEKGTEKIISDKISQITKDQLVINHLLQAAGATQLNVFYLTVFPNIPFEYVQRRLRRVPEHQGSLNAMTAPMKSSLVTLSHHVQVKFQKYEVQKMFKSMRKKCTLFRTH